MKRKNNQGCRNNVRVGGAELVFKLQSFRHLAAQPIESRFLVGEDTWKEASWVAIPDRAYSRSVLIPATAKTTKRDLIILASIFFSFLATWRFFL